MRRNNSKIASNCGVHADANNGTLSSNTFTGNSASVVFTNTSGIVICWASGAGGSGTNIISKNTFTGNSCDFSGSTGPGAGFYLQGVTATTTVQYNFVSGNTFIGASAAGVKGDGGICLETDASTAFNNNIVGINNVINFNLPYCQNLGAQVAGLKASTLGTMTSGLPVTVQ